MVFRVSIMLSSCSVERVSLPGRLMVRVCAPETSVPVCTVRLLWPSSAATVCLTLFRSTSPLNSISMVTPKTKLNTSTTATRTPEKV